MTLTSHRVVRVALITLICYFAVFTAACWICDVFFAAAFGIRGFWLGVFPSSGEVLTPVVFIASFFVLRWSRKMAVIGFVSCLLWTVWALLPRLCV
jgi:hypothetical protein